MRRDLLRDPAALFRWSAPFIGQVVLVAVATIILASVGLAAASPHYSPQEPHCSWGFASHGPPPPAMGKFCDPKQAATPLALKRGLAFPALLLHAAGVTLGPLALAMLLAVAFGVPLGAWAAARPFSAWANLVLLLGSAGIALPGFLVSFVVVYADIWLVRRTGQVFLRMLDYQFDLAHVAMPSIALACAPAALIAQSTAAILGGVYEQDYIRAARGRGIDGWRLFLGHILPVAAGPLLAAVAAGAQLTLSTIPLLEYLFNWPGLGLMVLDGVEGQDRSALAGGLAVFGALFVVLGLVVEHAGTAASRPTMSRKAAAAR